MTDQIENRDDAANEVFAPLYSPPEGELQLTPRAIIVGCAIGGAVCAMNLYFGLKTGFSIGGSLIAAILGFAIFTALRPARAYTRLENNITQTAGSAAGSMTSTAGMLAAIPALGMLGRDFSYLELTIWALSVAYIGVFLAVPLRNQLIVAENLRFPTGTATAETIMSMFAEGAEALAKARYLLMFGVGAAIFTLAKYFVPWLEAPPSAWFGAWAVAIAAWTFSIYISPLLFGAGILIGPRVGISLLLGAITSWAILGPLAARNEWVEDPAAIMSYKTGVRGWILWPGVAIMVADALMSLALSWRTVLATFKRNEKRPGANELFGADSPRAQIPNAWWIGGLAIATAAICASAAIFFEIPIWMTLIAIALTTVLAMIAVRSTGETDINPIGGMGKVTQLVFGGVAPGATTTNLMAAAISGAGASQAGDMSHDLKAGRLLGAWPRKQFIAQCFGIAAGVLIAVPIFKLFDSAYDIGGDEMPAPAAHAWKAMAELLSNGWDTLPNKAVEAVIAGLAFGALIPILRKHTPLKKFLPSGLAFGIAFIIPAFYSVTMFVGSMGLLIWQKVSPKGAVMFAFAVASGLIAGEGLMGVVNAILSVLGVPKLTG